MYGTIHTRSASTNYDTIKTLDVNCVAAYFPGFHNREIPIN